MNQVVPELIEVAARRLRAAAPDARIVLFGSWARGDQRPDSDLDLLVIQPTVDNVHAEMVRLGDVLRDLKIPVDVVVASQAVFAEWAEEPGTVYHRAATEGRVLNVEGEARCDADGQSRTG